ncbi:symmetrical bis(5'-nucleosyl)-tetraphosphatase [Chitinasiproducens palmae]|uniref:bis(5'-nucleosyl)-tetraphosphatase (symmetrical) n=1 Tax=Chitinasiproducens palmae TaxID=1770053 RepID=A0A1H2PMW7_9BURK|nr:symmetrical bis(5'-nucleosyl)-tetraphosphatase [Chitinasiproducens palmae]SDV47846.1 Bis(5'nucleosyl)-tetraphosphatase, ApaH [Chitinasiproducens palmae]
MPAVPPDIAERSSTADATDPQPAIMPAGQPAPGVHRQLPDTAPVVIGDVHGCLEPLERLLSSIDAATGGTAPLWFAGDIVNRGPQSLATLRRIIGFGERAHTVLGNHEIHLLGVAAGLRRMRPGDTIDEILAAPDADELVGWLRRRPLALAGDDFLLVHAGLLPQWTVAETLDLAARLQAGFAGAQWCDFAARVMVPPPPDWARAHGEEAQLSLALAALTRLRFCSPAGAPDWIGKDTPGHAPAGTVPWFDAPERRSLATPVVFGHWAALGLMMREDAICLDSGCVWGNALSAMQVHAEVTRRPLFQVKAVPEATHSA